MADRSKSTIVLDVLVSLLGAVGSYSCSVSADPQATGQCGTASVRNEPAMFPSVGLEWVSVDASSTSIQHILSFNPGSNTNHAMLLAHSSHGQVALTGSAEDGTRGESSS